MIDYRLIKQLDKKEIMSYVPDGFTFKTKSYLHQITGFLLGIYAPKGFLYFYDCGLGKTKILLDIFRYFKWTKECHRLLIVCLNSSTGKMEEEVEKHTDFNSIILKGSVQERIEKTFADCDVDIINYEGLQTILCDFVKDKRKKRKGKKRRKINPQIVEAFADKYDMMIIDESQTIRNVDSTVTKLCKALSQLIPRCYCDTGTPQEKSLLELWAQFYCADKGKALGNNYYIYRTKYFVDKGFWGPSYVPTKKGSKIIKERMWSSAVRYAEDECLDLPETVYRIIKFDLYDKEQAEYNRLVQGLSIERGGKNIEVMNRIAKCRQLLGGFIYGKNKEIMKSDASSKLDTLCDTLEEIDIDRNKVVIFHEFVAEGRLIEDALKAMNIKFCSLRGEVKNKETMRKKFINNETARVLVSHPISGGFSIDLVVSAYVIFYSNSDRWMVRYQCEKRVRRIGQNSKRVFYYDLLPKKTVDISLRCKLKKRKDAFDGIYNDMLLKKFMKGEADGS